MMYSGDEGSLSHYDVLGADPSADYAEIRRKYRAAALALHPDRFPATGVIQEVTENQILADFDYVSIGASSVVFNRRIRELAPEHHAMPFALGHLNERDRFLRVQEAWEILRDPECRARYDKFLSAQRLANQGNELSKVIGEEVYMQEMNLTGGDEGQTAEYTYPCRCGDYFVVSLDELEEAGYTERVGSGGMPESGDNAEQPKIHMEKGVQWQQSFLVLPCQSCSLHIRLHFALTSA